jgi:hypothetical protein
VDQLVAAMTDLYCEGTRREAMDAVVSRQLPWLHYLLIDRLVLRLRSPSYALRQQVFAALVGLGRPAVPHLLMALTGSRSSEMPGRFEQALTRVSQKLEPEERLVLARRLDAVAASAKERAVARACARASASLRVGLGTEGGPAGAPAAGVIP